jgi:bifunctional non-homologous end joining protein LigD
MAAMPKSPRANPTTRRSFEPTSPPAWIKPQLAKLVEKAPDGPDWLHEIKFDGYRMHARLDAGRAQILTRRGNDWTGKYPVIAQAIARASGPQRLPRRRTLRGAARWSDGLQPYPERD